MCPNYPAGDWAIAGRCIDDPNIGCSTTSGRMPIKVQIGNVISNLHPNCSDSTRDSPASGAAVQGVSRCHSAGPRQSGETTLCRNIFPGLAYANLEASDVWQFAESDPRGFLAQFQNGAIIDEVQRVPDLLSYIQVVVDEKGSNSLFVLTGSAQSKLTDKVQSLAGRTALLRLLPLSLTERHHLNPVRASRSSNIEFRQSKPSSPSAACRPDPHFQRGSLFVQWRGGQAHRGAVEATWRAVGSVRHPQAAAATARRRSHGAPTYI